MKNAALRDELKNGRGHGSAVPHLSRFVWVTPSKTIP